MVDALLTREHVVVACNSKFDLRQNHFKFKATNKRGNLNQEQEKFVQFVHLSIHLPLIYDWMNSGPTRNRSYLREEMYHSIILAQLAKIEEEKFNSIIN
jgi:hypothetical protein